MIKIENGFVICTKSFRIEEKMLAKFQLEKSKDVIILDFPIGKYRVHYSNYKIPFIKNKEGFIIIFTKENLKNFNIELMEYFESVSSHRNRIIENL